ncbi:hypothetical protein [Chryseobacterium indoltheticum]
MNGIEENSVIFCMRTNEMKLSNERKADEEPDFEYDKEKDNERVVTE